MQFVKTVIILNPHPHPPKKRNSKTVAIKIYTNKMQFKTRKNDKWIYPNADTTQRNYTPLNRILGAITGNESFNTATLRFPYPGKWYE